MSSPAYAHLEPPSPDLARFAALCEQQAQRRDYPLACDIRQNVVIYDGNALREADAAGRLAFQQELHRLLRHGPGVFVVKAGFQHPEIVDRHTQVLLKILAQESAGKVAADHFARAGSNGRIWNALQKAALASPDSFIQYYGNPLIGLIAEAWLGPWYQLTAQVNLVPPGGQAQEPHRDYHLGFQGGEQVRRFPLPVQVMSQYLTLQGAIAHSPMPVESGPTQLLPFSQQYEAGYLAWREAEFAEYFKAHAVQLPLDTGDMLFFNPALFHAAGTNRTRDVKRIANLLQISSAFAKPMETVDRDAMTLALYETLAWRRQQGTVEAHHVEAVIAACADGYSFPTNLDTDPPLAGLAPLTAQQCLARALDENWPLARLATTLAERRRARQA